MSFARLIRGPEARVVGGMFTQAAISMVLALMSARWLGPSDRGIIVITTVLGTLLMLVGSMGVATGGRILLGAERAYGINSRYLLHLARPLIAFHLVTASVVGATVITMSKGAFDAVAVVLFAAYASLLVYAYLAREFLHGEGKHTAAIMGEVLFSTAQLLVVTLAQVSGWLNLYVAQASMVLGVVAQVWYLRRFLPGVESEKIGEGPSLSSLLRVSYPALGAALGQAFALRADRVFLGLMSTSAAAGIYGSAASFSECITLVTAGVSQVVFRDVARQKSPSNLLTVRRLALLLTAALAILLATAGPRIATVLLGDSYAGIGGLLPILCLAAIPLGVYQLNAAMLNGMGHLRRMSSITIFGAASLAVLCTILVPAIGAEGAAWASVASYSAMALLSTRRIRELVQGDAGRSGLA